MANEKVWRFASVVLALALLGLLAWKFGLASAQSQTSQDIGPSDTGSVAPSSDSGGGTVSTETTQLNTRSTNAETVDFTERTVCCEKTNAGLACQNVPEEDCASDRKPPTACSSTSFCQPGWCFDSLTGICLDNVPKIVCNEQNGTWTPTKPRQCELGCCILGDQAAFVTQTRCKQLSRDYGLETNFNPDIKTLNECLLVVKAEEKGACVFFDGQEKTCVFTTRSECSADIFSGGQQQRATASPTGNELTNPPRVAATSSGPGQAPTAPLGQGTTGAQGTGTQTQGQAGTTGSGTGTTDTGAQGSSGQNSQSSTSSDNSGADNSGSSDSSSSQDQGDSGSGGSGLTGQAINSPTSGSQSNQQNPPANFDFEDRGQGVRFYPGVLCTNEELGTNCVPTKETTCLPGKTEVYFVDSCGNPANIYDASKLRNKEYWGFVKDKQKSCNPNSANINSKTCGNCNYALGSICREATEDTGTPRYGDFICANLNCVDENGKERRHGESWCVVGDTEKGQEQGLPPQQQRAPPAFLGGAFGPGFFPNSGVLGLGRGGALSLLGGFFFSGFAPGGYQSATAVGARYYRKVCVNGVIVTEPCSDFKQEVCVENTQQTAAGPFTEAACRVNRWRDCTMQKTAQACLNTDQRDCIWLPGIQYTLINTAGAQGALGGVAGAYPGAYPGGYLGAGAGYGYPGYGGLAAGYPGFATGLLGGSFKIIAQEIKLGIRQPGACVPRVPPGLKVWKGQEAAAICAQASAICPVTYEKGFNDKNWKCIKNCECDPTTPQGAGVLAARVQLCSALGDCGVKVNWVGERGYGPGYFVSKFKSPSSSSSSGGLF